MFKVEVTYPTKMSGLIASFTTSQLVASIADAQTLRSQLHEMSAFADAHISIKNAPPPTLDEAIDAICLTLSKYPVHKEIT